MECLKIFKKLSRTLADHDCKEGQLNITRVQSDEHIEEMGCPEVLGIKNEQHICTNEEEPNYDVPMSIS